MSGTADEAVIAFDPKNLPTMQESLSMNQVLSAEKGNNGW